jgi:hypothetical protein
VAGGWRRLHHEELHNLYASSNIIIRVIKSRRMRREGHVVHMGKWETNTKFWSENMKERDHSKHLDVDGKIISERIFGK